MKTAAVAPALIAALAMEDGHSPEVPDKLDIHQGRRVAASLAGSKRWTWIGPAAYAASAHSEIQREIAWARHGLSVLWMETEQDSKRLENLSDSSF